jgi:hypothetical protein
LIKPTNITKQNLPPFAASGDFNDAVFPMPDFIMEALNIPYPSFTNSSFPSIKIVRNNYESASIIKRPVELPFTRILFNPIPVDEECTYGIRTSKLEVFDELPEVFLDRQSITDVDPQKTIELPTLSSEILLVNEKGLNKYRKLYRRRQTKDDRKKAVKDSINKYKRPTREELYVYLKKFAQQMNENAIQFDKFCSMTT